MNKEEKIIVPLGLVEKIGETHLIVRIFSNRKRVLTNRKHAGGRFHGRRAHLQSQIATQVETLQGGPNPEIELEADAMGIGHIYSHRSLPKSRPYKVVLILR
ncbi:hypothetical protein RRG08_017556 [Elysia crispata]|uniref:Uncharacterized protein n=1 Tax=Elysia crispata TaxID=231223 RepID=A0AAE1DVZ3_9GAST|nr:hypothetical protein RRG08_017556 [Elysia crispata]